MYRVEVIAKLFGVTVRRIQQLTQEGVLPTTETPEGRRYDLVPTIQKYVKYLSDKAYGKNRSEKEMDLREQKLQADIALKEAQGELHNMKLSVASGQLVDVEKVKEDYSRFFTTFKKFAMSLPGRLTSMVSGYVEPLEARKIERDLLFPAHAGVILAWRTVAFFSDAFPRPCGGDPTCSNRNPGQGQWQQTESPGFVNFW